MKLCLNRVKGVMDIMKKISKIVVIILITIILIGNCYALAANENLSLVKLATINPNQTNFKVRFSGKPKVSNENKVKASVTNDLSATINVTGLTMKENFETVTYIVQNTSTDLSADLSIQTTNSNEEYFAIESNIEKTTLAKGEAAKVTITIKLIKEPLDESEKTTIGIQLKANPVQPTDDNDENAGHPTTTIPDTNANPNPNPNPNPNENYYGEKDDTPKTGNWKIIDVFWR